jgi:hypothetical protein
VRVGSIGFATASLLMTIVDASAQAQPAPAINSPTVQQSNTTALTAANLLERRYVNPAIGERYAATLRERANSDAYAAILDRQALADALTADLQLVHADGHIRFYVSRPAPQAAPAPTTSPKVNGSSTATEGEVSIAPGIRAMRWAAPGIAYISFEHFDDRPEAVAALRRFLVDYQSARAVVIDSRENHGGAFDMLGVLGNALFAQSRLLANMDMAKSVVDEFGAPFPVDGAVMKRLPDRAGLVRFQHWAVPAHTARWSTIPVFYLTSHATFSAAEHLAMVLKSTGRGTLIGETTGGGNHFGGTEPVGDGLELYVAVGRTTDPTTGEDWERVGIVPDVQTRAENALDVAIHRINGTAPPTR